MAETFWDGAEGAERLHQRMLERTGGIPVMMGSTAVDAAIKAYGGIRRIGIITPYMPVGDANVRRFFEDQGYEVRSEEHTSELQSLMRISYAVFCLKQKTKH